MRTPVWFVQILENYGNNYECNENPCLHTLASRFPPSIKLLIYATPSTDTEEQRTFYRENPDKLVAHIKELEDGFNARFQHNIIGTPEQKALAKMVETRMREKIQDERILKGLATKLTIRTFC